MIRSCPALFFQWVATAGANALQQSLARQGVLTRLFPDPPSLRFGLPGTERDWRHLEAALAVARAESLPR